MDLDRKLTFYRKRNFFELFEFTFDFFRENFKQIVRLMLLVVGPVFLVNMAVGITSGYNLVEMMDTVRGSKVNDPELGDAGAHFGFLTFFNYITRGFLYSLVQTFMGGYLVYYIRKGYESIDLKTMYKYAYRKVWLVIGLNFLMWIAIFFGTMALFIPGIWLAVSLSLANFIILFEDSSAVDALTRSYNLVQKNWWSTLGVILVAYLCYMIMGLLPILLSQGSVYLVMTLSEVEWVGKSMQFGLIVLAHLAEVVSMVCSTLFIIILAIQYFNLRERKEETGAYMLLDSIGSNEEKSEESEIPAASN